MSPNGPVNSRKPEASNNIYTAILGLVACVVLVTAVFVAYKCYFQYDAIFKLP